ETGIVLYFVSRKLTATAAFWMMIFILCSQLIYVLAGFQIFYINLDDWAIWSTLDFLKSVNVGLLSFFPVFILSALALLKVPTVSFDRGHVRDELIRTFARTSLGIPLFAVFCNSILFLYVAVADWSVVWSNNTYLLMNSAEGLRYNGPLYILILSVLTLAG